MAVINEMVKIQVWKLKFIESLSCLNKKTRSQKYIKGKILNKSDMEQCQAVFFSQKQERNWVNCPDVYSLRRHTGPVSKTEQSRKILMRFIMMLFSLTSIVSHVSRLDLKRISSQFEMCQSRWSKRYRSGYLLDTSHHPLHVSQCVPFTNTLTKEVGASHLYSQTSKCRIPHNETNATICFPFIDMTRFQMDKESSKSRTGGALEMHTCPRWTHHV